MSTNTSIPTESRANSDARQGLVLATLCAVTVLVIAFVAAINLAVPLLTSGSLHPSSTQLLWIVDSYVTVFACLVIPCGALGDRFGRKGVLTIGLILFAAGAAVSASSPTVAVMLIGRCVTGVGAACVLSNSLAILMHATPPQKRPRAIAIWASSTGFGGVAGNVGGGALLQTGSWRWLFVAVVPIALAGAAAVAYLAPRTPRNHRGLDPVGTVLLTAATFGLLVGVIEGPESGWGSITVISAFVASAALYAAWIIVELRVEQPLLDPRLFRLPLLRAGCLGMTVAFFGLFALFYVNASFLQYAKGFSVLTTGLAVIPLTIPLLFGARFVPLISARLGSTITVAAAFAFIGVGMFGLSTSTAHTPYIAYALWLVVIGIGAAAALPVLTHDIADSLPLEQAGVGSGLQATAREFGSALGVAVIGTILTSRFISALPDSMRNGDGAAPRTVADGLEMADTPLAHDAVLSAFTTGADSAVRVIAIITLIAGCLVTAQSAWSNRTRTKETEQAH